MSIIMTLVFITVGGKVFSNFAYRIGDNGFAHFVEALSISGFVSVSLPIIVQLLI